VSLERWYEVARGSGLGLAHVAAEHVTSATFHALRREMTQATMPSPSHHTSPWLHGARRDVAVIVHTVGMRQVGETAPNAPNHTCAIAEIDPPLFAGLRLFSRGLIAFFGAPLHSELTAHPSLDTRFVSAAFDMPRVREILLPHGLPDRLGEAIAHAAQSCNLVVRDSTVEAFGLGVTPDHDRVEGLVDIATSLAREISVRARNLRQTPLEISGRQSWQRLAASLGLSVDPLRWHMFGALHGVEVSAMLDGSPPAVSTTFRARFRSRLAYGLLLRRDFRGKGDTGFPDLDGLFALRAHDPMGARMLFADPRLRQQLAAEASTSNLVLDEREVVVGRGGFASPREIGRRLESLVAIVDRMTPAPPTAGPFR
jgi:hypothetical protein